MNLYTKLPRVPIVAGRQDFVLEASRGKRVLHIGCVDAGLLQERFERHALLHQRIAEVAEDLWGVDIDAEGIAFLNAHGFTNLIVGDVCEPSTFDQLRETPFDLIIASEVVEHLENPGAFLRAVRTLVHGETELLVTVPNAYRIETLLWLLRGVELVHPDHNFWFSYRTITNLVEKTGFRVTQVKVYSLQRMTILPAKRIALSRSAENTAQVDRRAPMSPSRFQRVYGYLASLPRRLIVKMLYRRTPFWGDGLIVVARRDV